MIGTVRRRTLLTGLAASGLAATAARGAPAPQLGDKLDLSQARSKRRVVFSRVPEFSRHLSRSASPGHSLPFDSPAFAWNAGYVSTSVLEHGGRSEWMGINDGSELAAYPNAAAMTEFGVTPFASEGGALVIRASRMPDRVSPTLAHNLQDRTWMSGAMTTWPFGQTYGVFSVTAQCARGNPLWPAFWLLPTDLSWPPECDVFEWLGGLPTNYQFGMKSKVPGYPAGDSQRAQGPDWSAAPVTVTTDWGPDFVAFYVGRRGQPQTLMNVRPTPPDWHKPMYAVLNLAIGAPNSWPVRQTYWDGKPTIPMPDDPRFTVFDFEVWDRPEYGPARAKPGVVAA